MYTVIILNKQSSDLLKDYKFLFKPFVDKGVIGFCDWNETGTDVKTSVPDLCDLIKGKKDWRALIVDTDSIYGYADRPTPKKNNPFDYSDYDKDPLPHESEIPLIKLTHIIGGYTSLVTKEFEKGFEFYDPEQGETVRVKESELSEEEVNSLSEKYDDITSVYIEKEVPEEVKSLQKTMMDKYLFSDIRPAEIDLIATRQKADHNERAAIEESWKNRLEMTSSNFWEVNKYPNNCRFLVYDITNQDNSFYKKELTEFWMSVLTLATNKIAASTLQAYRLYKIKVDVSKEELQKTLNTHLNKLNSVYAFVKEQISLRPESSFDEDEEIVSRQTIPVTIEKNEAKELFMNFDRIGLCKDHPEDESVFWKSQIKQKKNNLEKYLKTPRRVIDKSANYLKKKAESFKDDNYILDQFQIDDLKETMDNLEFEIVSSEVKRAIDKKSVDKKLAEIDGIVKKEIGFRMSRKMAMISGALILLVCFGGYLPYLISAGKVGSDNLFAALGVTTAVLCVSAIGGLISLILQRVKLVNLMKQFNTLMRNVVNDMRSFAGRFETYFSDICTYMKAVSILNGTKKKSFGTDSASNILLMHKRAIAAAASKDNELILSYDIKRIDEMVTNVTTFFDVNRAPRDNSLYFFEENLDEDDIPINSTGDKVTAPYKFIEKLWVEREDVYDEEEA